LERADPVCGPLPRREWKKINSRCHSFSVVSGDVMLNGAKAKAEEMGVSAAILSHMLNAEQSHDEHRVGGQGLCKAIQVSLWAPLWRRAVCDGWGGDWIGWKESGVCSSVGSVYRRE